MQRRGHDERYTRGRGDVAIEAEVTRDEVIEGERL
jgi:hypothetical protein